MKATPRVLVSDRVSRRDFLKLSSLVAGMGGVMVLSGCGPAAQEPTTDDADDETRFALLENSLMEATQVIVDIYSRFLFENAVFEARKTHIPTAAELNRMMLDAQRESYGDGLDARHVLLRRGTPGDHHARAGAMVRIPGSVRERRPARAAVHRRIVALR